MAENMNNLNGLDAKDEAKPTPNMIGGNKRAATNDGDEHPSEKPKTKQPDPFLVTRDLAREIVCAIATSKPGSFFGKDVEEIADGLTREVMRVRKRDARHMMVERRLQVTNDALQRLSGRYKLLQKRRKVLRQYREHLRAFIKDDELATELPPPPEVDNDQGDETDTSDNTHDGEFEEGDDE